MARRGKKGRGPKPPVESVRAGNRAAALVRIRHIDQGYGLARAVVNGGVILGIFYFLAQIAGSLAGRNTQAILKAFLDVQVDRYAFLAVAVLASGGYLLERRQRKRVVADHAKYISELESRIDPGRSNSRLTETGDPRKDDLDGT